MKNIFIVVAILALVASVSVGQMERSTDRDEANSVANGESAVFVQPKGDGSHSHLQSTLSLLYDNGPLVTHPGGGFGGADASALQSTVLNSYGSNQNATLNYRIADDVVVIGGAWTIDSVAFFGYQTGSTTTSTFTSVHLQIWNGPPNESGSTIVFGDLTTDRMIRTAFSNIYRSIITNLTASDRPIMRNVVQVGTILQPGTYWLDWNMTGSLASGPWQPSVTILGQYVTGNGRQFTGSAWQAIRDSIAPGSGNPQGVPFLVYGTASSSPLNAFLLQAPAAGTTITTLPGSATPVVMTWDTSTATATYKWIFGSPTIPPRLLTQAAATNSISGTLGALDAVLAGLGVQQGDSLVGQWDVWAFRNNAPANDSLKSTNGPRAITLKRGRPVLSAFSLVSPASGTTIVTSSVVTTPIGFGWRKSGDGAAYRWKFATPVFPGTTHLNVSTALDTFAVFRRSQLDSLIDGLGVAQGDSIVGQWRAYAYSGPDSLASIQTFDVTFRRAIPPATFVLAANPGPSNNGGSSAWAMFLDLIAGSHSVTITDMTTSSTAVAGAGFSIEFFTRAGTSLGGPVGSGPGSSSAGWTSIGTVPVTQGSTANGISLLFAIPAISINAGDTVGVAMRFNTVGPRYFGTGTPAYSTYSDANLSLVTGDARSAPFTTTGTWFASRALVGEIHYTVVTVDVHGSGQVIPSAFALLQNYPNPFNPTTTISYQLPAQSHVTLRVYDVLGREVETLVNRVEQPGYKSVTFDGGNLASGMYFYRLQAGDQAAVKKFLLLK